MFDYETLKLIWWVLICVLLIGFVITDGFDMGVGALLPVIGKTDEERRIMINTIAPHWEGNQVWLVLAAGAIFAAWPTVYATAFSGFYVAMMLTLFALFFRPVGFDYRSKMADTRWRTSWDWGIFIGSAIPPIIFGVAFANLLQGVPFTLDEFLRSSYQGGIIDLLNPFALLVGVFSLMLFVLQGSTWLQMKTEGALKERARKVSLIAAPVVCALFAIAGIWLAKGIDGYVLTSVIDTNGPSNPLLKTAVLQSGAWLTNYDTYPITMVAPALGLTFPLLAWFASKKDCNAAAFVSSSIAILGVLLTCAFSMFPFIMPSSLDPSASLTLWDAVSSEFTLNIMTIAAVIFLPLILLYTSWAYFKMFGRIGKAFMTKYKHSAY
ncbi:cytochrome d ubiquinol oxidase subunit II [Psychromonas sp. RZ22]|uniref:cytochrome d ubiquinol oxidase subunit II n=1 Tax=Psychromonas algarum TaxID=2555643 RepID=UPI001067AD86|nr:cytochrome d ubiquinol oxidase subunit II [Psychromonas sp. RZ22]TEW53422.1 cytochrome d ubiquinol oxidase subunit II [Psychromonas sp. RZ22]